MKKFTRLDWLLTIGGLLLAAGGNRLGNAALTQAGVFLLGGGLALAGLGGVLTGRKPFSQQAAPSHSATGQVALFNGAVLMVIGVGVMAGAVLLLLRGEAGLIALLRQRPGIILVPLGAVLLGKGCAQLLGVLQRGGSAWGRLLSLPYLLAGLIVGLLGLLALVLGLYEMLDPLGFDRMLASNLGPLLRLGP
jgi:hypothetical protein